MWCATNKEVLRHSHTDTPGALEGRWCPKARAHALATQHTLITFPVIAQLVPIRWPIYPAFAVTVRVNPGKPFMVVLAGSGVGAPAVKGKDRAEQHHTLPCWCLSNSMRGRITQQFKCASGPPPWGVCCRYGSTHSSSLDLTRHCNLCCRC
jgi:hypothetical protein